MAEVDARATVKIVAVEYLYTCPKCRSRFADPADEIDGDTYGGRRITTSRAEFDCPDCGEPLCVTYPVVKSKVTAWDNISHSVV